jgi:hypothetical protein
MSAHQDNQPGLYGLVARFDTPETLYAAAEKTRDAGYTCTDAHTPFPVHGLWEALGMKRSPLPWIIFFGGVFGFFGGLYLQYWVSAVTYPLNVGGRPFVSWPSWIPVTFECTVLAASLTAIVGMLAMNKLPQPYHEIFNAPGFERASEDGFYLAIEAKDPQFEESATKTFLRELGAEEVHEVSS